MLPPIPPSPEEKRRGLNKVPALRREAQRRTRRRRVAFGGVTAAVVAAAVALSAWLVPSPKPSKVNVIGPSSTTAPVSTVTTAPSGTTLPYPGSGERPSLVYAGPGVAVVGISPSGSAAGTGPARLYLSTDMVRWIDVTPPQSQTNGGGGYGWFEQASFLSPSVGWVIDWNPATVRSTIYRTSDGGKTWTTVPGIGHSANAGAATLIDLVSPTTAFQEQIEPTGPGMTLSVTNSSGQSWRVVYTGPQPTIDGRFQGPFEMPMTFVDSQHGFAAVGAPPASSVTANGGEGDFFSTADGGSSWQRQTPPLPVTTLACPNSVINDSSVSCVYTLPQFTSSRDGTVAAVVTSGGHAQVAIDVTSDGGHSWARAAQLPVTVTLTSTPSTGSGQSFAYPLISFTSSNSWWVLERSGSSLSTEISNNHGANWTTNQASLPQGVPISLDAFSSTHALLSIETETSNSNSTQLLVTQDGGRHWTAPSIP